MKKWIYNCTTNTVWTSFDYGEVEAETREEALAEATRKLQSDLDLVNRVLSQTPETAKMSVDMELTQIEIVEIV